MRTIVPTEDGFVVDGFDAVNKWNPHVNTLSDGSIKILFQHFPTQLVIDRDEFDEFPDLMAEAIGTYVTWEDRELFIVDRPAADTMDRLKTFLLNYGV
jgi:hypothetical protein